MFIEVNVVISELEGNNGSIEYPNFSSFFFIYNGAIRYECPFDNIVT